MSRIRTVKPEMWQHPKIARVNRDARLLFIGLLNESDDEGRLYASPKALAGALFPHDQDVTELDIRVWCEQLENARLLVRYSIDGTDYLYLPGFTEHQRISHPSDSRLPPPPLSEDSANECGTAPGLLTEDVYREGKGKERKGTGTRAQRAAEEIETQFDQTWAQYPRKEARKAALKAYTARRREGVTGVELQTAVENYAVTVHRGQKERQFVMHGATFFGPDERWRDFLSPPVPERRPGGPPEYRADEDPAFA